MNNSTKTLVKLRLLLDVEGIGSAKLFSLLSKFSSLESLFDSNFQSLKNVEGISNNLANKLIRQIDNYSSFSKNLEVELEKLDKLNAKWVTYWSKDYPINLKNIYSPPIILYYLGSLEEVDNNSVSIVGTRMASLYGKKIAENFSKQFAEKSITVVSGMARGIDTIAHRGSLSGKGRTIAVIGSGLDVIYPPENKKLFEEIIQNGAVITEYTLGTKPEAQNFPKRNRIISGFSLGTLVVETKISGGAVQTASFALEQNREVFAIPGNIGVPQSEGTNMLIQKGEAKLVSNCDDILVELNLKIEPKVGVNIPKPPDDLNMFEQKIYDLLSAEPKQIDLISKESNISSSECLVHLLSLEFRDLIKQLPGKTFILN